MNLGKYALPQQAKLRMQGVATWKNPGNKFHVFLLHYSADPDKRSLAWRQEAMAGFGDGDWDQEMELDFGSWTGLPVFRSFSSAKHVSSHDLPWVRHTSYPVIRGWDIGTHACVWGQIYRGRFSILAAHQIVGAFDTKKYGSKYKGYEVDCSGLGEFIRKTKEESRRMFGDGVVYKDIADPAARNHTIVREKKPSDIFYDEGISLSYGLTQDPTVRVNAVEDWLKMSADDSGPAFIVDPSAVLVADGMAGGYAYDKNQKPDKKSPFSHVCDCVEYIATVFPAPRASKSVLDLHRRKQETWESDTLGSGFGIGVPRGRGRLPEDWLAA